MKKQTTQPEEEGRIARLRKQRRKIRRGILLFCLLLIPVFLYIQSRLFLGELDTNLDTNILIFALINVNILLVLLVLFLVLRTLAEFLFESRARRLGNRLKTKMIASFLSLTLIPTVLLFFVALQFISTSLDYWFNSSVEESLQESLQLAQSILSRKKEQGKQINQHITAYLHRENLLEAKEIDNYFQKILQYTPITGLDALRIISLDKTISISRNGGRLRNVILPEIPAMTLEQTRHEKKKERIVIQQLAIGSLISNLTLIQLGTKEVFLVSSLLIEPVQMSHMQAISSGVENYRQLKHFKEPFKFWLVVILLIVTLLVVFAAIWFALYISRGLTLPLENLVLATQRIAGGDLEFEMESDSPDEMGQLVRSFNQMTANLSRSNKQLAEAHQALQASSQESEQRRRYTEIILQNVSAGVISVDSNGVITTINRFAEKLLNIDRNSFLGFNFTQVLPSYQADIVNGFIEELEDTGKQTVEQRLRLNVLGKTFSLLINFTRLENEEGEPVGHVLVFDNLTKLEKMQRMAAWREVARRIAHEIKNPLTPIQLSAQRLRRRYPEIVNERDSVFDQCTNMIIVQVDELKRLVSEFSQFARMPKVQKSSGDLAVLVRKTAFLYQEAHKEITFSLECADIPQFSFDQEQIKRCLINLLDNAVAVLPDGGTIAIRLHPDKEEENVFLEVADNGPGIKREDRLRLFEPYFSTKKTGTGLGLAIVSTIVSDHNGYIRIQDNQPQGSIFIIELPLAEKEL